MYNSIGPLSHPEDLYRYINLSESQAISEANTKRRTSRIVFDPFVFTLFLLLFITIVVISVYYLIIFLPSVIMNFNNLIENTIPNELTYYHSLLDQHNRTLVHIESNILTYMNLTNIVLNTDTLQISNHIIENMDRITSSLNITQIQNNLDDIVNTLNRILPHLK
jgi:hypothetical protein